MTAVLAARASLAGALLVISASLPGQAQDAVVVSGSTTGGLQFGDGGTGATAGLNGQIRSETRTLAVTASGGLNFFLNSDDTDVSLTGRVTASQLGKRTRLNAGASYSLVPFSFDEIVDDVTIGTDEGERMRASIFAGITHELSARSQVSGDLSYTNTDFDPVTDDQVPSDDYRASARITQAVDQRTSVYADFGLGWFTSDADIDVESFSASGTVGGEQAVNDRTRISGGVGLSFVNTEETVGGLRVAEWTTALLFDAGLEQDYADGTLSLGLSQRVTPSAAGELELNTSLTAGLEVAVNRTTTVGLNATVGRQVTIDDDRTETGTLLQISPFYAMEIVDGVNATARYTLRDTENDTTHRFNIGLSRSFGGN